MLDDTESPTTILDEEEIESTDASYHDKEEVIHEFTNKIINDLNKRPAIVTRNDSSEKDKWNSTTTAEVEDDDAAPTTTTNRANLIDSIEQRLTKRGELQGVQVEKKLMVENDTNKIVLLKGTNATDAQQV